MSGTAKWALPHLDPLQAELQIFFQKVGVPQDEKGIYGASIELKRLLGFVKRRAHRREVTKD